MSDDVTTRQRKLKETITEKSKRLWALNQAKDLNGLIPTEDAERIMRETETETTTEETR